MCAGLLLCLSSLTSPLNPKMNAYVKYVIHSNLHNHAQDYEEVTERETDKLLAKTHPDVDEWILRRWHC